MNEKELIEFLKDHLRIEAKQPMCENTAIVSLFIKDELINDVTIYIPDDYQG